MESEVLTVFIEGDAEQETALTSFLQTTAIGKNCNPPHFTSYFVFLVPVPTCHFLRSNLIDSKDSTGIPTGSLITFKFLLNSKPVLDQLIQLDILFLKCINKLCYQ